MLDDLPRKSKRQDRRANGGGIGSGKVINKIGGAIKTIGEIAPLFLNEYADDG